MRTNVEIINGTAECSSGSGFRRLTSPWDSSGRPVGTHTLPGELGGTRSSIDNSVSQKLQGCSSGWHRQSHAPTPWKCPTSRVLAPPATLDALCIREERCHRNGACICRIIGLSPWSARVSSQKTQLLSLFNKIPYKPDRRQDKWPNTILHLQKHSGDLILKQ